ncbi:AAA family ATPase [Catellatospora sp. NPDC049111]|uniref:AAA family ATPase n=1 Tax=Catellatospora sp. NPDC049111 TaxID=3155271 RepID=UPI00340A3515
MDADESLQQLVLDKLAADGPGPDVTRLIIGAYAGDDQLTAAMAGAEADLPMPAGTRAPRPSSLYLESVTVAGFRGVGPSASVRLQPHAGLTLIVGRNGSGKSSFAEAAELALTGDSARWAERNSVFRDGWRNLHHADPCSIEVTVRADGVTTPIRITRTWQPEHTDPGQAVTRISAHGNTYPDIEKLGWTQPMQTYRPFLTAGDLGRLMTATPSGLFDALAPILGIDPITDADQRIMRARRDLNARVTAVKTAREDLLRRLADVSDERARAACAILAARRPDLAALDTLLADADDRAADPAADACRHMTTVLLPEPQSAIGVAAELAAAADLVSALQAERGKTSDRLATLLDLAIVHHDTHGDGPCPVCGAGSLDADWHAQAASALARMRTDAEQTRQADRRLDQARNEARSLLGSGRHLAAADDMLADTLGEHLSRLRNALAQWSAIPADATPQQLATHISTAYPGLYDAMTATRDAAAEWLRQRHDAWRAHAAALQDWLGKARGTSADEPLLAQLKAAREWLRDAAEQLRTARLAPFASQSQQIWDRLRQESNVELSGMRLDGTTTRRRVAFPVTVDGTATSAMAVMSQGELQALGLAVFLPRACAQDSPFKFLIIDDPVHSMDPSKVDGLAQVLDELARDRQVIVFTHDNRLPEAVRRLQIDATIWEVQRREGSVIELRKNLDPVRRYLDDANALAKTNELVDDVRRPVVAGFCRSAIEAASHERIRRHRIHRGERHAQIEELIDRAQTLTQTVALAMFDDQQRGRDVLPALNRIGPWAADAFKACQENVHGAQHGTLETLVQHTTRLVKELR